MNTLTIMITGPNARPVTESSGVFKHPTSIWML
jgi:hypothetical protein